MVSLTATAPGASFVYPDSDGQPMAENTKQLRWIVVLFGSLCALFRDAADVFIAADLLWYPVKGRPEVRAAPDVLAVFGRPKGDRGSYKQWEEGDVALTVVFEILSPGNNHDEMIDKLTFYELHGVEEYYIYNPDTNRLHVYLRQGTMLRRQLFANEFVSPRLNIRFGLSGPEMAVFFPDGRRFLTPEEQEAARIQTEQQARQARQEADEAKRRAEEDKRRADNADRRARRLAALARAARLGQASPEELVELEQLERDLSS